MVERSRTNYQCLISQMAGDLVVWDLGTGPGTFVNGTKVTHATLKPGDTLKLGEAEFAVKCEDTPRRYVYGVRC